MIHTRNKYLQFLLVLVSAWAIIWGTLFVMGQAVLLYGEGQHAMFASHGVVFIYLLPVFFAYRRWVAPLPVFGQLRNVGAPWLVGAMAVLYIAEYTWGKATGQPTEAFVATLYDSKALAGVITTTVTIFVLAPLNEETLFRGFMMNVFHSRHRWTLWLGAVLTSLLFAVVHSQYQNLSTLAEMFLVGMITSMARMRSGGLLLPVLLHMEATGLGLLLG
ncbi:type II CAAX prenyl endopeptidase Rce1 family protein [Serratia fonticola]|uniref:CPBP family glutamic-type intramembrane protease n=1 Tax=Serratia fonticola TaxID=47917 RepID=UPI0013781CF1|nr:CPBP family intramembrane metalloprotease [Serratia fonticola]